MARTTMVSTLIGVVSFLALLAACARPLDTIRIDGSAGVAPLVSALLAEYRTRNPAAPVEMASGMGSSARSKAVEDGRIEIAMASHGIDSADLLKRGLTARPIARTAVVFAVNASVPMTALSSKQLCDVYAGRVRNWRELGGPDLAIRAVARPKGEVDADVALEGVPCLRDLALASSVQVIDQPDEMARVLAATAGAIGVTSAPMVEQSAGRLKSLTLDGMTPSVENVAKGAYALSRQAILIYKSAVSPAVARFLEFVGSADGQRVIRANGAVPLGTTAQ